MCKIKSILILICCILCFRIYKPTVTVCKQPQYCALHTPGYGGMAVGGTGAWGASLYWPST